MFAELGKTALTTAIPLDCEFMVDVPMKDLLRDSENGGGLMPGGVGVAVDVQGGGERLRRRPGEHARVLRAPRHRARYSERAVSG